MTYNYKKLWKMLIDKEMTKTELRVKAGISTNILAKMGKNESVALDSLAKICLALNCTLDDVVEIIPEDIVPNPTDKLTKNTSDGEQLTQIDYEQLELNIPSEKIEIRAEMHKKENRKTIEKMNQKVRCLKRRMKFTTL